MGQRDGSNGIFLKNAWLCRLNGHSVQPVFVDVSIAEGKIRQIQPPGRTPPPAAEYEITDARGRVTGLVEKPAVPPSNHAVTGLYFLDGTAPERARGIAPSARGEVEITTLLEMYLAEGALQVERMGRGFAWLDTGTHGSLLDAGNFVRTLQSRQGLQTGCPEEIAYAQGWIDRAALSARAEEMHKNDYGRYLQSLLEG
ncbi:hypothetical protein LCGC14_1187520 [marine sediment metagenome]|uniref:glucose-1-phosphate thymidylyltransferase n=1 Tax=marine sediment metagenome TaxID=412755 RepID=A0A0F9P348_9ZZZZ